MFKGKKTLVRATLTLIGTIIGAGIFGVPAMMERVGVIPGSVLFAAISVVVLATHLLLLDVVARDPVRRRFPGYLGEIFGPWAKRLGTVTHILQISGANFAYIVLGGIFIAELASVCGIDIGVLTWQIVFWGVGVVTVVSMLRVVSRIESLLTWLLVALLVFLIGSAVPQADIGRIATSSWGSFFAPFGVFLFAMFGMTVIPEVYEIAGRRIARSRLAVIIGTLVAAVVTWSFGVFIHLATPPGMAGDLGALAHVINMPALRLAVPLIGFLAVITSFITNAFDLQAMIRLDLRQRPIVSKIITLGIPFVLLFIVQRDFLAAIDVVGALFAASNGLLVVVAASAVLRRRTRPRTEADTASPFWWRVIVPTVAGGVFVLAILQRVASIAL
ncbi:hypothetical protein KJ781_02015 [Patescibacteria group bacterium]|nr:hypothetical protein [Patescibacteria group bacterium]MBU1448411.1 hypothetical protein [Patescibacteria group bacterium]MBU2613376.1 hypothetical protein [Patescibacteria group bacterium]